MRWDRMREDDEKPPLGILKHWESTVSVMLGTTYVVAILPMSLWVLEMGKTKMTKEQDFSFDFIWIHGSDAAMPG